MARKVKDDAVPFPNSEFVEESGPEFAEAKPQSPNSDKKEDKKRSSSKSSSGSSSDSDFGDSSTNYRRKPDFSGRTANIININKAQDVHIGHKYMYSKTLNLTNQNCTESDYGASSPIYKNGKGPKPSEELLSSIREIDAEDMYIVAENVSRSWKKLARLLPPRNVFSDGQIKTFEDNNPHNQEEAIYEMLKDWKQKCPKNATIGTLVKTLWDIGRGDVAQKLNS